MQACVVVLFLMGLLSLFICKKRFRYGGFLLGIAPAILFILFFSQHEQLAIGDVISSSWSWLPQLGVNLDFYLDGLSGLFAMLITGIGTLIVVYSYDYLGDHPELNRYYFYLFSFMASMLACVLSDNLITLFVFWEMTSVTSYLLISFNNTELAARRAALQALLVTAGGGLIMLAGFVVLIVITGQTDVTMLFAQHQSILKDPLYPVVLVLILFGAFTKSAQYPFHFWLPNAMQAPTPISAYLHSATMVKLGIFLLARFTPILGGTSLWTLLLTIFGSLTMITGAYMALRATDLKQILAYSTVMALGTLVFLLATQNPRTIQAAMIFLLAHALYKAALFLCVGIIDHTTGTREIALLGGLRKKLPFTFIAVGLASASMCGLPMVLGFITKETIYQAQLAEPRYMYLLLVIAFVTNVIFCLIGLLFFIKPFFGKINYRSTAATLHEASFSIFFAPLLLGLIGLLFGLYPSGVDNLLIDPAMSSILQNNVDLDLALWHGITPALLLSILTVMSAGVLCYFYDSIHFAIKRTNFFMHFSPEILYYRGLQLLYVFSKYLQHAIQVGYLRTYTMVLFLTLFVVVGWTFFSQHITPFPMTPHAPWFDWALSTILVISACATVVTTRYFASLAFLGIVGLCCTLIFLIYSAPDVAMTQLLVDVLTIVIVVLALYRLPSLPRYQHTSKRWVIRNIIISLAIGFLITSILLSIINQPFDLSVNQFYTRYSLSLANGRNIVNVILVDFRAFDTLGEMTVVGLAGFGVYGLLKVTRKKRVKK